VWVARIKPERLIDELRHWRQDALARKVEIVHEPALSDEKADKCLRDGRMAAALENCSKERRASDRKGLARRPSGHSIVAVFS
jgi:hypothetical protein